MTKKSDTRYEVATHRRFLSFLNAAQHPHDLIESGLLRPKDVLRQRGPHPVDPDQPQSLIDEAIAQRIVAVRNERSPLYGFAHIDQLRDWLDIDIGAWWNGWICLLFGVARYGSWERLAFDTPVNVAQAALLHTPDDDHNGRVILIEQVFGDTSHETPYSRTPLWKPEGTAAANAFEEDSPHPPGLSPAVAHNVFEPSEGNLYCSAHAFLSDGSLLAVGGGGQSGPPPTSANMAWIFDPTLKEWHPTYDKSAGHGSFTKMNFGRWYPTAITLGDDSGRVLVVGGSEGGAQNRMEVYNESTGRFTTIDGPPGESPDPSLLPITWDYPNLHLIRNGEVFFSRAMRTGTGPAPARFTFAAFDTGRWSLLTGSPDTTSAPGAMSALLIGDAAEPDRVIQAGKNSDSVRVIEVPPTPSTPWQIYPFPDGLTRDRVNLVLMPDGTVLIAGGTTGAGSTGRECYLFDPAQTGGDPFIPVAGMSVSRSATHEQALLLPSAQVATFGSGREIEIFTPPYLYNDRCELAPRPEITNWPNPDDAHHILHGHSFTIETPQAADIGRMVLIRPMSVTHQMDTEQRVIPLCFTRSGKDSLSVLVPDGRVYPYGANSTHTHAIAPRGVYMLFILDNKGVPSEARFVRLR